MSGPNYPGNVVPFRRRLSIDATAPARQDHSAAAYTELTAAMVMAKHARGQLEPELLAALLAGVGLPVNATDGA